MCRIDGVLSEKMSSHEPSQQDLFRLGISKNLIDHDRSGVGVAARFDVGRTLNAMNYPMRTGRPKATELIPFYAVRDDLLPVLEALESNGSVKYVRTGGQLLAPSLTVVDHGKDIPTLGTATSETGNFCETFLVCKPELQIIPRSLRVFGEERFFIDQLHNPNTVTFTPAGMWNPEILLAGGVGTASDSQESQKLMKRFHSAIRRYFVKIKAYWVGHGALELLQSGKRLTDAVQSPPAFDLTIS